jgi:hypothetical protein
VIVGSYIKPKATVCFRNWITHKNRICPANYINPINAELNPICHLLTLLGAHPIFHVSKIRVKHGNKISSRNDIIHVNAVCQLEKEDYIIVKWEQEDVETLYNVLNK